jgi:AcrR family transcriptional regulator
MARARSAAAATSPDTAAAGAADDGRSLSRRYDLVTEAILENAAEVFANRGLQGSGIREIAEAMNLTRPAIYHYFRSKDELLEQLLGGYGGDIVDLLRGIREDEAMTAAEKVAAAVNGMALHVASKHAHVRLLAGNGSNLPRRLTAVHAKARNTAFEHLTAIISDGVEAGELRRVDPRVAAFALFGMCLWIAWWYRPEHRETSADTWWYGEGERVPAEEVASEMADIALNGLTQPKERRSGSISEALELLRDAQDRLERLVDSPSPPSD